MDKDTKSTQTVTKKPELICSIPYLRKSSETMNEANEPRDKQDNASKAADQERRESESGRRKKQPFPQRSADLNDSNFRGVYFTMETRFVDSEPRVVVTSVLRIGVPLRKRYGWRRRRLSGSERTRESVIARRLMRRARNRSPFLGLHQRTSDSGISLPSDTDDDANIKRNYSVNLVAGVRPSWASRSADSFSQDKKCVSCGTTRTPLWRGAEQGAALCNACGIRYRKYRLRCIECWHVPRRDQKQVHSCSVCGAPIR